MNAEMLPFGFIDDGDDEIHVEDDRYSLVF
jgi:hypothetical protein